MEEKQQVQARSNGFHKVPLPPDLAREIPLSENARTVLRKRYLRRGEDGQPVETEQEMFWRVAYHVAKAEEETGGDVEALARRFYDLLTRLEFFPNSPTFTGAGTPLGQLAACFTAEMRVVTEAGLQRIADLRTGERVLTHEGRYRAVTQLFQRIYEGELLRIRVKQIGTTLEVTPEHPILTPAGWVKAGQLKEGDKVAVGVPQGIRPTPCFDLAASTYADELELQIETNAVRVRQPSTYQNSGRQAQWVNRFIDITPEMARLCGYYVAEGTIGPDERYVRFTFGLDETNYHQDVQQLVETVFGLRIGQVDSNHGNWTSINVYSRAVSAWFREQFGHGSASKKIPTWLQYAEPEIQEQFLVGLMRGDGLFFEKSYQFKGDRTPKTNRSLRVTLANPGLIHQIWQLFLRLRYDAAIRPVDVSYVTPNAKETAQVTLPPLCSRDFVQKTFGRILPEPKSQYLRNTILWDEDQPYFEIASIESSAFSGVVYNCEVDEDHSYVTEGVVVHNCFVLPIDDDMGRTGSGIFETLRNAALIQQTGGGNGFSFSRLRPKGAIVRSSNGEATGPVGFLRVYDQAFGEIAQGGSRRGANMAVLRVDHPDVREFITCKTNESAITNFNISVGITEKFMRAVEIDGDFELVNPQNGKVWETVKARDLFDQIVKQAYHNGEPGVLFLDTANRENPVPHLYELESTNPCGEQYLGSFENCCLGSINLAQHMTPDHQVDWEKLRRSVETSTRFLDDVVSANAYVPAVPQLREAAYKVRRIGLGIMGLADMMYELGVRYGSAAGQEFASQLIEFVRYHAMQTSIDLAEERSPFTAIEGSLFDPQNLKWQPPQPMMTYVHNWGRPALDWSQIVAGIQQHGIRNGAVLTVAPTGTISTVAGCEGYGCEPVFALAYMRYVNDKGKQITLQYTSPLFERALRDAGLSEAAIQRIVEQVNLTGTCQNVPEVPDAIRRVFVVSADVTAEEHVRMQAVMQRFTDNAISKTVNMPNTATESDVAQAYQLGWKLGCKGLTVYVTGSREKVVLETAETKQKKEADPAPVVQQPRLFNEEKKPRPRQLSGKTYRVATPLGATYVTVNENGEGRGHPFEIFLHTAKAGSETAAISEALGRLISYILRLTSPVSPRSRLMEIVRQLSGIGGSRTIGFGPSRVGSLPDGIAQVLQEYLDESDPNYDEMAAASPILTQQLPLPVESTKKLGDLCPECGAATLVNEEGCRKCYSCGFSEC